MNDSLFQIVIDNNDITIIITDEVWRSKAYLIILHVIYTCIYTVSIYKYTQRNISTHIFTYVHIHLYMQLLRAHLFLLPLCSPLFSAGVNYLTRAHLESGPTLDCEWLLSSKVVQSTVEAVFKSNTPGIPCFVILFIDLAQPNVPSFPAGPLTFSIFPV